MKTVDHTGIGIALQQEDVISESLLWCLFLFMVVAFKVFDSNILHWWLHVW